MFHIKSQKAQGALEYLLIIGGGVLISVIVIALLVGAGSTARKTAVTKTDNAQAMGLPGLPSIVSIIPDNESCVNGVGGRFNLNWLPQSTGGSHKIVVKNFAGQQLLATSLTTGSDELDSNTLSDTIYVDLNTYNNSCMDTFSVTIEAEENNTKVPSSSYSFEWKKAVNLVLNLISPSSGTTVNQGESIDFNAVVDLNSAPIQSWSWSSSKTGDLGHSTPSFSSTALVPGIHTITVEASDGSATVSDSVSNITVNPGPAINFSASINQPQNGQTYTSSNIDFNVILNDADPYGAETCTWTRQTQGGSSETFKTNDCSDFTSSFADGTYSISLTATSYDGLKTSTAGPITITVDTSGGSQFTPIDINITSPQEHDTFGVNDDINFLTQVSGPANYSCKWQYKHGGTSQNMGNDCNLNNYSFSEDGNYIVAVTATDDSNTSNKDTDEVNIVINNPLMGHWDFHEAQGSTLHDVSQNSNDGHINDKKSIFWDEGAYKGKFNGKVYVMIHNDSTLNVSSTSISTWFKITGAGGSDFYSYILNKTDSSGKDPYSISVSDASGPMEGSLRVCLVGSTTNACDSISASDLSSKEINLVDGYWHFVAITYNGSTSELNYYVDNKYNHNKTMTNLGNLATSNGGLYFGTTKESELSQYALEGAMGDTRIYNTVLGSSDIEQIYAHTKLNYE